MLKGNKFKGAKVRLLKQITKDTTAPLNPQMIFSLLIADVLLDYFNTYTLFKGNFIP